MTFKTKITHFSDIAMEISENQYAQTLLMSQLRSNFLVDSLMWAARALTGPHCALNWCEVHFSAQSKKNVHTKNYEAKSVKIFFFEERVGIISTCAKTD